MAFNSYLSIKFFILSWSRKCLHHLGRVFVSQSMRIISQILESICNKCESNATIACLIRDSVDDNTYVHDKCCECNHSLVQQPFEVFSIVGSTTLQPQLHRDPQELLCTSSRPNSTSLLLYTGFLFMFLSNFSWIVDECDLHSLLLVTSIWVDYIMTTCSILLQYFVIWD